MPRKQPAEKYVPGSLPDSANGLVQFLYDELPRIAEALNAYPPAVTVVQLGLVVPVDTIPIETRLFENSPASLDVPGGYWDATLGEWTVPATGLYQFSLDTVVYPFGAGNFQYDCILSLYINDVLIWSSYDNGDDDRILGASLSLGGRAVRGDVVRATITIVDEQFTGNSTVDSYMTVISTAVE